MSAFLRSFHFAFQGIGYALCTQRNARVHAMVACMVIAAGIYFRISAIEWAILALTIGTVFSAEMINTVAELAVDLLTQHYHPMAKVAKDVGAGVAIFGPRVWAMVK